MATNRLNFMPPYVDPISDWDTRMRGVAGGDPNFFRYGRFGLLSDDSALKERIEGPVSRAPGSGYNRNFINSGMAPSSFGGGSTSDNPGGYNWDTLQRNLDRIPTAIATSRDFRKMLKADSEEPQPLLTPANRQSTAAAMTYSQAQDLENTIQNAREENPFAPGLSLEEAQKTLGDLQIQYFGVGPVRKQSRNPAVQQPKKAKSTAPKINSPKPPGA